MTTTIRLRNGSTLTIEREQIDVTVGIPVRDPGWSTIDENSHPVTADTVRWVVDHGYWCEDCGDNHEDGHYECPVCGLTVTPGTISPGIRQYVPGPIYAYLDGEAITRDELNALVAAERAALADDDT